MQMMTMVLGICLASGFWGPPEDHSVADRKAILQGVRTVAAPGAPGSLAVLDPSATVLVAGKADGPSQAAVIACGRLGKGRVVAFAHDGYFSAEHGTFGETSLLLTNAMKWAAHKPSPAVGLIAGHSLRPVLQDSGARVAEASLDQPFSQFDVLVLTCYRFSPDQLKRLRHFVVSGGGLLVGATAWAWQENGKQPYSKFPGNELLDGSGVAWTSGIAEATVPGGFETTHEISPFLNAATALKQIEAGKALDSQDYLNSLQSIRQALPVLPENRSHFRSDVRKTLKSLRGLDLVPTETHPVLAKDVRRRFAVGLETVLAESEPVAEVTRLAAASQFPGGVAPNASRGTHRRVIPTAVPGWHSLGLYAAPGEKVVVTVPRSAIGLKLTIQVGSHTDSLWHLDDWKRLPQVVRRFPISHPDTTVASGLGGLIYIDVPEKSAAQDVSITVKNALESPLYRLGRTTRDDWKKELRHAAPWAELAGKNLIFTVPSAWIRELDDPSEVMMLWDRIVAAQDEFVSLKKRERPERIACDVQISAGYMHSGYPIMIPIDASIKVGLNVERLRQDGSWGLLHELGHNHQNGDWTFDGTGEVTNNLIVLYVQDKVLGLRFDGGHPAIRDRDERDKKIRAFFAQGSPHNAWKSDPFLALMMYIQVYEAFGAEPFRRVFAEYARLPAAERPRSDTQKRDQWLQRLSRATGKNLGPFFQSWGVPTSDPARASVARLPAWMPKGF